MLENGAGFPLRGGWGRQDYLGREADGQEGGERVRQDQGGGTEGDAEEEHQEGRLGEQGGDLLETAGVGDGGAAVGGRADLRESRFDL